MSAPSEQQVSRFSIDAPEGAKFTPRVESGATHQPAVSPDGRRLAFVAARQDGSFALWVRALSEVRAQALPATDDALFPFWSPDSRSIGFFANGKLKVIALDGTALRIVCDGGGFATQYGGTWSSNGTIIFASGQGWLSQVSVAGGVLSPATRCRSDVIEHLIDGLQQAGLEVSPKSDESGEEVAFSRLRSSRIVGE